MKRFFSFAGIIFTAIMLFLFTPQSKQMVKADSKINTTTSTVSSSISSVYGQPVTFTATITTASGTNVPTGDVVFNITGYGQFTERLDPTGKAAATLSTLQPGTYVVFAVYNGDANFNASVSPVIIQAVTNSSTTTKLSSSADSIVYGEPVTFTTAVIPISPGEGTPTGNVIFSVSGDRSITEPLDASGKASATIDSLSVGSHIITATYSGNAGFYPSVSLPMNFTVNQASTTALLTSNQNPSDPNQTVTFIANITPVSPGTGVPTGTVIFTVDGTPSVSVTLVSGKAIYSINTLTSGEHIILAQYSGDSNFTASSSQPLTQNVRVATSFSLLSSKNPSNRNDSVTFTTSGLPTNATGSVTFFDSVTELGTSALSKGKAEFTVQSFSAGDHIITAQYSGNDVYLPSTSSDFTQTVSTLYSYTIQYINFLDGKPIASDIQNSGELGEKITVTAPKIDGYLLQDNSSKTFTIDAGSNIETFYYVSVISMVILLVVVNVIVAITVLIILRISA